MVNARINGKVEIVSRRLITLAQELCQPWAKGDAVQTGAISVLRAFVMVRIARIEGRFKILHQIIAASAVRQSEQVLHRRPEGREGGIGVSDRSGKAIILRRGRTKMLEHILADLLVVVVTHQLIGHDIDPAGMAKLGEITDDAKQADISASPGERLWNQPVDEQGRGHDLLRFSSSLGNNFARSAMRASGL